MQFTVPQFIEREPKIVGPFTFKQFSFIGIAGSVCIFLYFTVPFLLFLITAIALMGSALSLAVLKIEKIPLPVVIKNFFLFLFKPKIYLWKKKSPALKIYKKQETAKKEKGLIEKESPLRLSAKGKLRKLFTKIEVKK